MSALPTPRNQHEYDLAHESYDRWLRELERLETMRARAERREILLSPESLDGLNADIAECRRTVDRYQQLLEPES